MAALKTECVIARALFTEAESQGFTVPDLAKMLARHPNSITNWRQGKALMSLVDANMLAGALGFRLSLAPAG